MKSIHLLKSLVLLSILYFPLAIKQIDIVFTSGESVKPGEYSYVKIWTDTCGNQSILKKLSASWSETMRVFDEINNYYSNSFGFKKPILNVYRDFKMDICGISPWPDKVILGEKGWLFVGNYYSNGIKEAVRMDTFDDRQLATIRNNYRNFETWRKKQGFAFYIAITPDKPSVYGDYLPIIKSVRPGKLDQLKKNFSSIGIEVIDLKDNFPIKKSIRLFHKTDSHWNDAGAFLGYQVLISRIKKDFPDIPEHSFNEYTIDSAIQDKGDLSWMLTKKIQENWITLKPIYIENIDKKPNQFKVPDYFKGMPGEYEIRLENPERKYSILIFRDSFLTSMIKFFANDFKSELFLWNPISRDMILKTKPDIVVYETNERALDLFTYFPY